MQQALMELTLPLLLRVRWGQLTLDVVRALVGSVLTQAQFDALVRGRFAGVSIPYSAFLHSHGLSGLGSVGPSVVVPGAATGPLSRDSQPTLRGRFAGAAAAPAATLAGARGSGRYSLPASALSRDSSDRSIGIGVGIGVGDLNRDRGSVGTGTEDRSRRGTPSDNPADAVGMLPSRAELSQAGRRGAVQQRRYTHHGATGSAVPTATVASELVLAAGVIAGAASALDSAQPPRSPASGAARGLHLAPPAGLATLSPAAGHSGGGAATGVVALASHVSAAAAFRSSRGSLGAGSRSLLAASAVSSSRSASLSASGSASPSPPPPGYHSADAIAEESPATAAPAAAAPASPLSRRAAAAAGGPWSLEPPVSAMNPLLYGRQGEAGSGGRGGAAARDGSSCELQEVVAAGEGWRENRLSDGRLSHGSASASGLSFNPYAAPPQSRSTRGSFGRAASSVYSSIASLLSRTVGSGGGVGGSGRSRGSTSTALPTHAGAGSGLHAGSHYAPAGEAPCTLAAQAAALPATAPITRVEGPSASSPQPWELDGDRQHGRHPHSGFHERYDSTGNGDGDGDGETTFTVPPALAAGRSRTDGSDGIPCSEASVHAHAEVAPLSARSGSPDRSPSGNSRTISGSSDVSTLAAMLADAAGGTSLAASAGARARGGAGESAPRPSLTQSARSSVSRPGRGNGSRSRAVSFHDGSAGSADTGDAPVAYGERSRPSRSQTSATSSGSASGSASPAFSAVDAGAAALTEHQLEAVPAAAARVAGGSDRPFTAHPHGSPSLAAAVLDRLHLSRSSRCSPQLGPARSPAFGASPRTPPTSSPLLAPRFQRASAALAPGHGSPNAASDPLALGDASAGSPATVGAPRAGGGVGISRAGSVGAGEGRSRAGSSRGMSFDSVVSDIVLSSALFSGLEEGAVEGYGEAEGRDADTEAANEATERLHITGGHAVSAAASEQGSRTNTLLDCRAAGNDTGAAKPADTRPEHSTALPSGGTTATAAASLHMPVPPGSKPDSHWSSPPPSAGVVRSELPSPPPPLGALQPSQRVPGGVGGLRSADATTTGPDPAALAPRARADAPMGPQEALLLHTALSDDARRPRAALRRLSTRLSWHYNFRPPWPGEHELRSFVLTGNAPVWPLLAPVGARAGGLERSGLSGDSSVSGASGGWRRDGPGNTSSGSGGPFMPRHRTLACPVSPGHPHSMHGYPGSERHAPTPGGSALEAATISSSSGSSSNSSGTSGSLQALVATVSLVDDAPLQQPVDMRGLPVEGASSASAASTLSPQLAGLWAQHGYIPLPGAGGMVQHAGLIGSASAQPSSSLLQPLPERAPRTTATAHDLDDLSVLAMDGNASSVDSRLYGFPEAPARRIRCAGPPDSFRLQSLGLWDAANPDAAPTPLPGSVVSVLTWSWLVEWTSAAAAPPVHPFAGSGSGGLACGGVNSGSTAAAAAAGGGVLDTLPTSFFLGFCEQHDPPPPSASSSSGSDSSGGASAVTRTGLYSDGRTCRGEAVNADEFALLREAYQAVADPASALPSAAPDPSAQPRAGATTASAADSGSKGVGLAAASLDPSASADTARAAEAVDAAAALLQRATERWDGDAAPASLPRDPSDAHASASPVSPPRRPPPLQAPAPRVLPPLSDGDVVTFVYRAAEGSVDAFVNGWRAAALRVSPHAWAYPMAAVFSGFARLRLVRFSALVHEADSDLRAGLAGDGAGAGRAARSA